MKNKILITLLIIFAIVVVSGSYISSAFFNGSFTGPENTFKIGEWVPAQTQAYLLQGDLTYSNQEAVSSYSDESGEHFQISIDTNHPQFLSFQYKLQSEETARLFDEPAVIVSIGQVSVLQIVRTNYNTEWHTAFVDVSQFALTSGEYDLLFTVQNTFDELHLPSLELREVTTTKLFATPYDFIQFIADKPVQSLFVSHRVFRNNQEETIQVELETIDSSGQEFTYTLPPDFLGTQVAFWSVDLFNNIETTQFLHVSQQLELGASQFFVQAFIETDHELSTQIQYQNDTDSVKYFDARISQNPINTQLHWDQAQQLQEKQQHQYVQANVPVQASSAVIQTNLVFENIPSGQSYVSIKICTMLGVCEYILQNHSLEYPL
ncbi:MAG: hypothetical protein BroJett025_05860 [Patescibacteria group bacterium]|nr:MAG: hypothetical protein BroJett025_05860 [Patescibacteria group bacterium]